MSKAKQKAASTHVSKLRKPGKTRHPKNKKGNPAAKTSKTGNGKRLW